MNSKWMCISHHLPKYVFNRFQQCEISGGLSQISGIRSIVKRRFGKSLRVLECLRRHRVDPGLSDSVFASGFIRAINMDRSQSQLAKKYWVKSEEWVEATRHVTRVLPKQQVLCNVYQCFILVSSPRDLPVDQSASFVYRNAAARFEPTSLKVGRIHSRHCRWKCGATPPEALEELQSGSLGSLGSTRPMA